MTTRGSLFVLVALLVLAAAAGSMAIEPDRMKDTPQPANDKSRAATTVAADPKAIAKLIEEINAAARTNKQRMISIIVINTDISAATLEQEKAQTGLTYGDLYVAHSLGLATKKKFSAI